MTEQEIIKAEQNVWERRMERWGLYKPDETRQECLKILNTEYEKIESELPEMHTDLTQSQFEAYLTRIEASVEHIEPYVGQGDSEVRQALITRIAKYYNVDYDVIYCVWLGIEYDPTNYADYKPEK